MHTFHVQQSLLGHILLGGLHFVPQGGPPDGVGPRGRGPTPLHPRLRQSQSLFRKLDQSVLDVRVLRDVEGRLPGLGEGANIGAILIILTID